MQPTGGRPVRNQVIAIILQRLRKPPWFQIIGSIKAIKIIDSLLMVKTRRHRQPLTSSQQEHYWPAEQKALRLRVADNTVCKQSRTYLEGYRVIGVDEYAVMVAPSISLVSLSAMSYA